MKLRGIAVVAALTLLASCGGDSATNVIDGALSGSLSFSFTGGGDGTFSATGAVTSAVLASSPFTTTWATGFKDATDNSTNITANIARTSTTSDLAIISVKGQSTGTVTIDPSCAVSDASTCNEVSLVLGQNDSTVTFGTLCTLTSGSITVSSLSSTKATGTFSGSGTCGTSTGSITTWVVTNGAFDVPLLASVPANIP